MDPNETLRQLRALTTQLSLRVASVEARGMNSPVYDELAEGVAELSELFQALDEWLSRGGFPPEEWREGPDAVPDDMVLVPKDSCEADHPTEHLQCWGSYGHDGPHFISGDREWTDEPLGGPVPGVAGSHLPEHDDLWKDA